MSFTNSIDLMNAVQQSVNTTRTQKNRPATQKQYNNQKDGKYGFEAVAKQICQLTNTKFTIMPPAPNVHSLLEQYFELRAVIGNKNNLNIRVCQNNNPVGLSSIWGSFSSLQDYYYSNGLLGNCNPCREPGFQYYFSCLVAKLMRQESEIEKRRDLVQYIRKK